jgi:MFS family permease
MVLFKSLTHRSFALLWSGQTISRIGDFMYQVALAWWVLEKTGSAIIMGTVLICSFTPMLLFLLVGGVAVDRLPRVQVMLAADLIRGAVVTIVAVLAFAQLLEVWHIFIASLLFGLVDAFFQPAYTALVPEMTPPDALLSANSLTGLSQQAGRIVGPALGAAIIGLGGTSVAFALNGLSFFLSAACLVPLLGIATPRSTDPQSSSMVREISAGIGMVLGSPWLWITITISALTNVTLSGPFSVALPFLVKDNLHADVGTLGLLYTLFPIGYVIAEVWLGRLASIRRRGLIAYCGLMCAGLAMLVLGLPIPIVGLALAALLNGAALEVFSLIWTNTLQERVPQDMLGRVASIDLLGSFVLLPVGFGVTGWATSLLGAPLVCVIGGVLTAGFAALGLAHPAIRALD